VAVCDECALCFGWIGHSERDIVQSVFRRYLHISDNMQEIHPSCYPLILPLPSHHSCRGDWCREMPVARGQSESINQD
jgi:hypothetical protein